MMPNDKKMSGPAKIEEILQNFYLQSLPKCFWRNYVTNYAKFREIFITKFHEKNSNFVFREIKKSTLLKGEAKRNELYCTAE
jgi:hypothetical protein